MKYPIALICSRWTLRDWIRLKQERHKDFIANKLQNKYTYGGNVYYWVNAYQELGKLKESLAGLLFSDYIKMGEGANNPNVIELVIERIRK